MVTSLRPKMTELPRMGAGHESIARVWHLHASAARLFLDFVLALSPIGGFAWHLGVKLRGDKTQWPLRICVLRCYPANIGVYGLRPFEDSITKLPQNPFC